MDVRSVIREARRRSGLTQRLLARRAGTSHSTLAAYESGAKTPTMPTLVRIIEAAGFRLELSLVPLFPFEDRRRHGAVVADVLDLAGLFPAKHDSDLDYPVLRRHVK